MRCPYCGAALGSEAAWCGLCLARLDGPAAAPAYAAAPTQTRFGTLLDDAPGPPLAATPPATAWGTPPVAAPPPALHLDAETPRPGAGWTTAAAIAVGALVKVGFTQLVDHGSFENEALIRYSIVTTLGLYLLVAWLVAGRLRDSARPLRWTGSWGPVPSALLGLATGGTLAWIGLATSGGAAHADAGAALLVSEGTVPHVAAAALLLVVAAPVVEELLFRGLLLESFRHLGGRLALFVSAVAFAAWHLIPSLLVYYSLAGLLLGVLYLRKGLACSIAAHAAFNGTLLVAVVSYALSPGPVVTQDGITLRAPSGWHSVQDLPFTHLVGPSHAEVVALRLPAGQSYTPAEMVARVQTGVVPELAAYETDPDTARTVDLPAGEAMRVDVRADGRDGELVLLPTGRSLCIVMLRSGGSARVRADFTRMLNDLDVR
jgi:membrane protease YdiL (CAAX protease family)